MSVIDQATFDELKQISGEDFINELIDAFLDDAPNMLNNMETALKENDVESFRRNAHSLKSNANTFGAMELGTLAKELEFMAKENNMDIGNRLEILKESYATVAEELKWNARMKSAHEPGHLLIVDDNKVNRILLARGLEQDGHKIETAENGRQGLEMLKRGTYDLLLLDIEMPELNGYQVLEACLQDDDLRNLPVIMTSSLDEIGSVVKCVEMGAEDYLNKPINPILLRARVNASLEKKRLRDEQQKLIRTFTTKEVAEQLSKTGFSLGGKFVNASVMFADIRSFTTLTESRPPAEIIEILNDYYALMFEAITSHGGSVNQMIGDGLMAIFGAPVFYEDHCERAVNAAKEMLELLEAFNQDQAVQDRPQLKIGVGIASGTVIAGFTGTQHRATYTCVGDTVNLAARLETQTKVIGRPILIEGETRSALNELFKVESHGPIQLKGKTIEVEVFSVS